MVALVKIALGQINNTVGDFDGNVEKIKNYAIEATAHGADMIVFPELAVCGYPCRDLVELDEFQRLNYDAVNQLVDFSKNMGILMIVGALGTNHHGGVRNSAYVIHRGEIIHKYAKMLLPTYDVFDEARNFTPGSESKAIGFNFGGRRIGLSICEDWWANPTFKARHNIFDRYEDVNPPALLVKDGCDLLINLSASPFTRHKLEVRRDLLFTIANDYDVDTIYCNMVGGNDSLVFDGNSMAVSRDGAMLASGSSFESGIVYVDFEKQEGTLKIQKTEEKETIWNALVLGVRDYVRKCGFSDVVIGLSGGIDSALVAVIAAEALGPNHVTCITMPSEYSSEGSVKDSVELAHNHDIGLFEVPIQSIKNAFVAEMAGKYASGVKPLSMKLTGLADENIQARIRGVILMAYSNQTRALVLSTGNKSETAVGYCTIYGDMCGGLSVIADVPKTMVYALARWYNNRALTITMEMKKGSHGQFLIPMIPKGIITKAPSAELAPGQYDQQSLPPYDVLDYIIHAYVEEKKSEESIVAAMWGKQFEQPFTQDLHTIVRRVLGLIDRAEYKRQQAAPTLKVTSKAWYGRFMPIAKKSPYREGVAIAAKTSNAH